MFAPGVPNLMEDFKSDNETIGAFVVRVHLLGYCFGPLLIAPLSEMYECQPLYNACNLLYTIFNVACALAPDMASLIVFRLFAGLAGSCPLTLGAGSLADMIAQENRGAAMAAWALGLLLGPVIGPVGE
jgi:MFS family permease